VLAAGSRGIVRRRDRLPVVSEIADMWVVVRLMTLRIKKMSQGSKILLFLIELKIENIFFSKDKKKVTRLGARFLNWFGTGQAGTPLPHR
jgi:hypothetical protein